MNVSVLNYQHTLMATPYLRTTRRAFASTSSALKWEGGVSMVQGASRGIGLEFDLLNEGDRFYFNANKPSDTSFLAENDSLVQGKYSKLLWLYLNSYGFVKQLLEKNEKGHVIATCRNPNGAIGLLEMKNKFSERLDIQKLDLTNERTIEDSAKSISERYGSLNLLINASGVLSIPDVMQPETTLTKVQKSSLMLAYEINAVGPILVIKHMWPLLKAGGGSGTKREVAVVASLSARVGSIGDNHLGGWHSYRASKTALNQLTKNVAVEFARRKDPIVCLLLHPGTVDTDLSKPFQRNVAEGKLFTKEFSVQKLLSIINNAKSHNNGKFFAWDGQEIPW